MLFLLDVALPATHFWGRYLLLIVLAFFWGRRRDIYLVSVFTSVLVVATYWAEGPADFGDLLLNYLLPLIILWGVAWLMVKRRQLQEDLDVQVKARTAALAASERRYHDLYDNSPDMYVVGQPRQALISDCNQTLARNAVFSAKPPPAQVTRRSRSRTNVTQPGRWATSLL